jgi:hypothetical protein
MTIYIELTRELNAGRLRAVICSGQAAVLHKLAIASKDGDWILREDREALDHVLRVLAARGARYRFGAPLDPRWMEGGWSSHLEFLSSGLRVRTDFFTRPPRVSAASLARMWSEEDRRDPPFTGPVILAEMKKTAREKDYPFIAELARRMKDPRDQLLYSRSAEDLIALSRKHPELARELAATRPLLARVGSDRREIAEAIQLEMLDLVEVDRRRLDLYRRAASHWAEVWQGSQAEWDRLPLLEAHARLVAAAEGILPEKVLP